MQYEKTIIPMIEASYNSLTVSEKAVADFFINNEEKMDFSAKSIAAALYTSEACLSRFAKKCGFDGYREFIYRYQELFTGELSPVADETKHILNVYQNLLTKTYALINEEQIRRVARMFAKARRVFVYGKGSSGVAGEELKMRFMRLGIDIECITDSHVMKMNSAVVKKGDLAVGITVSGRTQEVVGALKTGKDNGAMTVILTSQISFKKKCDIDEVVLIAAKENLDLGNLISPQFPVLVLCDIIYANVLMYDKSGRENLYSMTLEKLGRAGEEKQDV